MPRSFIAAVLCVLGVVLLGASPLLPAPSVIVYPFTVNGDADKESGGRLAVLFATQMAEQKGLVVKPAPPGTERQQYLTAARAANADYYVAGYVTPLGQEVAVVEQVVSTATGVVIYSNTAQLLTYADAAGQGAQLATAIVTHANRGFAALTAPTARPAATPSAAPNEANIGGLFKRRQRTAPKGGSTAAPARTTAPVAVPAPAATATPRSVARATTAPVPTPSTEVAVAPATGGWNRVIVLPAGGPAPADARSYATRSLLGALTHAGATATVVDASDRTLPGGANALCSAHDGVKIVALDLATRAGDPAYGQSMTATVDATAYDCTGTVLRSEHAERSASGRRDMESAVDKAIGAVAGNINSAR